MAPNPSHLEAYVTAVTLAAVASGGEKSADWRVRALGHI